jgi:beta-lactamase superfamily II metal-dependent hydrolase
MAKLTQYRTADSAYDGPFDNIVGWRAASMGDVIQTENGHLIVVDGGNSNDAEGFLALLEELSGGKQPIVDLWFITHPHGDHYYALRQIAFRPELAARITVKTIVCFFPEEIPVYDCTPSLCTAFNQEMERIAAVWNASTHKPHRDEHFLLDDVDIRMLYVPDDCSFLRNTDHNALSLIFTVQGPKHRAMITGDAVRRTMQITRWRYPSVDLACDYLQMPHHGLCDVGCMDFYKAINAKTLLIPTCVAGDRAMHSDLYFGQGREPDNRWAEENADVIYNAFEGTVTLDL